MSASQNKKGRQGEVSVKEARLNEQKKQQQASKSLRTKVIAVAAAVVVLIAFVLVFDSNLFYTKTAAVEVNGEKYSAVDFNYYYVSAYNEYASQLYEQYGDYAGMFMPMGGTSFRDQVYDSETGETWADVFEEQAINNMKSETMLWTEGQKAGFELSEDDAAAVEDNIAALEAQAKNNNYSTDGYLVFLYGKGMNEELFRKNIERTIYAGAYRTYIGESFEYTDDEIVSYYNENADKYDYITYRAYLVNANVVKDDEETEEDETVDFETAMAEAEIVAKDFVDAVTDEASYIAKAKELAGGDDSYDEDVTLYTVSGQELPAAYSQWLLSDERKEGDVSYIALGEEESSLNGYYVVYFIERDTNDYFAVNGYYALVNPETVNSADYDNAEDYEAAVEEAIDTAEAVMEFAQMGYEPGDDAYKSFEENCVSYSSNFDAYGPFDQMGKNSFPEEVSEWLFDEGRKVGDTGIITTDEGVYYMFYNGTQEVEYYKEIADAQLRTEEYTDWSEEKLADYTAKTGFTMLFTKKMSYLGA